MSFAELASALNERSKAEMLLEQIREHLPSYPSFLLQKVEQVEPGPKDPDEYKEWRRNFGCLLNELKDDGTLVEHRDKIYLPEQLMLKKAKKKKASTKDTLVIPQEIMGVMHVFSGKAKFEPLDASLPTFPVSEEVKALNDQIVTVVMDDDLQNVMEILSVHGTMTDDNALGELSRLQAGIPKEFPKDILEGISLEIPEVSKDRKDFTHIPFITIDPETAKDFDDAIFVRKTKRGWKVMVAIADVSHYVKTGSELEKEIMKRGNSTYFPDHCIPMQPEELSNGVCSLKPNVNRAAVVCTMHVNKDGTINDYEFERGLIKSRARLTYDQVQESIDAVKEGKSPTLPRDIWPHVKTALEVYNARLKDKKRRGALEINMAEQSISIGRGRDISLALEIGNESHGIIEELAVAANECAGEATDKADVKSMYRVHGSPRQEIYDEFRDQLTELGVSVPKTGDIRQRIVRILAQAKGSKDPDHVQMLVTRMQSLASYSTEPDSHFGLGLRRYSHFTSPIRRASDLYEHMTLNEMFKMQGGYHLTDKMKDEMSKAADHFSMTERRSERAVRECEGRMLAMFMRRNLSKEFEATVTQINGKKLWVLVEEDGISIKTEIPANDLPKNLYDYSNGDKVCIQPAEANEVTGVIKFRMV